VQGENELSSAPLHIKRDFIASPGDSQSPKKQFGNKGLIRFSKIIGREPSYACDALSIDKPPFLF